MTVAALQLAESYNHSNIAQYLKLNGAEHESYDDIWAVMVSVQSFLSILYRLHSLHILFIT